MALCKVFNERGGKVCWTKCYLLVGTTCGDGVCAQVCMALCEVFNERGGKVCWTKRYLLVGKTCGNGIRAQVCMALCKVFNERRESAWQGITCWQVEPKVPCGDGVVPRYVWHCAKF